MRFFLALLLLPTVSHAVDCPLGPREDKLTLSRVMRNFGSFTLSADSVADIGKSDPASIQDADIQVAITKLRLAEACALAVVNDPTEALLPAKAEDLKGQARDAYIKLYRDTMQNFYEGLQAYEGAFSRLLARSAADRDYAEVETWKVEVDARATHAHEILQ